MARVIASPTLDVATALARVAEYAQHGVDGERNPCTADPFFGTGGACTCGLDLALAHLDTTRLLALATHKGDCRANGWWEDDAKACTCGLDDVRAALAGVAA